MASVSHSSSFSLHEAAAQGVLSIIRQHLVDGANIEGVNADGRTALHAAVMEGQVEALNLLIEAGANIDAPMGALGITALHMACYTINRTMVERVISYDPDLEARMNGVTPLFTAVSVGDADIVQLLLDAGADATALTMGDVGGGESILHMAVAHYKTWLLRPLLQRGADANVIGMSPAGQTALHIAAQCGNAEALQILIAAGADVLARYTDGTTALHLAAYHGHVQAAEVLLKHGLDVSATDQNGEVPLYMAAIRNQKSMVGFLLNNGAGNISERSKIRVAMSAAASGRMAIIQMLEQAGFNILAQDEAGETGLSVASYHGNTDMVVYLLKSGADPGNRSQFGTAAVDMARGSGHDDVARLLEQAEEQRATDSHTRLFPGWRYTSDDGPTQPQMMAGLLSVVGTRMVRSNQEPAGVIKCAVCKDLDFRRGIAPEDHVVYFLEQSFMESAAAGGCRGCQFVTDCISTIEKELGSSVLERAPPGVPANLLVLHSIGQGAPLLIQPSDLRSLTRRRIEVYVNKGRHT